MTETPHMFLLIRFIYPISRIRLKNLKAKKEKEMIA